MSQESYEYCMDTDSDPGENNPTEPEHSLGGSPSSLSSADVRYRNREREERSNAAAAIEKIRRILSMIGNSYTLRNIFNREEVFKHAYTVVLAQVEHEEQLGNFTLEPLRPLPDFVQQHWEYRKHRMRDVLPDSDRGPRTMRTFPMPCIIESSPLPNCRVDPSERFNIMTMKVCRELGSAKIKKPRQDRPLRTWLGARTVGMIEHIEVTVQSHFFRTDFLIVEHGLHEEMEVIFGQRMIEQLHGDIDYVRGSIQLHMDCYMCSPHHLWYYPELKTANRAGIPTMAELFFKDLISLARTESGHLRNWNIEIDDTCDKRSKDLRRKYTTRFRYDAEQRVSAKLRRRTQRRDGGTSRQG